MINAYVILSRVKSASGLALLRAFSPELFESGPAPGPLCLLKFLLAKNAADGQGTYTTCTAEAEYKYRLGRMGGRLVVAASNSLRIMACH